MQKGCRTRDENILRGNPFFVKYGIPVTPWLMQQSFSPNRFPNQSIIFQLAKCAQSFFRQAKQQLH